MKQHFKPARVVGPRWLSRCFAPSPGKIHTWQKKEPGGLYYCPAVPKDAHASIGWSGGNNTAQYYQTTYLPTIRPAWLAVSGAAKSGGWLYFDSTGSQVQYRKFFTIKNGSALFGETNYRNVGSNSNPTQYRGCYPYAQHEIHPPNHQYSWGWNHELRTNLTFVDGHIEGFRFSGGRLLSDDLIKL